MYVVYQRQSRKNYVYLTFGDKKLFPQNVNHVCLTSQTLYSFTFPKILNAFRHYPPSKLIIYRRMLQKPQLSLTYNPSRLRHFRMTITWINCIIKDLIPVDESPPDVGSGSTLQVG